MFCVTIKTALAEDSLQTDPEEEEKMNWDALYERAFEFEKLGLWEEMTDDQLFAVRANHEVCYISIMGFLGQHFALGVYVGDDGLRSYYHICQPSADEEEKRIARMSQNNIQCAYLSKDQMTPEERKPVRAYAREHSISMKNARYPLFLRVSRFQRPDDISEDFECDILREAFDAALWLGPKVMSGRITIPRLRTNTKTVPLLVKDGSEFRMESTPVIPYEMVSYPVGHTDETELMEQTRQLSQSGRWACKLILLNATYTADGVEGEFFPWELVIFDAQSRHKIPVRRCRDYENRPHVLLRELMKTLLRISRRPESILVSDLRTQAFLSEWCRRQNIDLLTGELPDELDSLINASLYEEELERNEVPEPFSDAMEFYLLASDEDVLKMKDDFDQISAALSSMLSIDNLSEPLRNNIEKVLWRFHSLQIEEASKNDLQSAFSVQGYLISVSLDTGCYRHIEMSADASLDSLSDMILHAFSFDNDHLHAFYIRDKNGREIEYNMMETDFISTPTTSEISLREAGLCKGKKFKYLFDFGDNWLFQCRVLRELDFRPKPRVVRAKGEAPEQYPNYEDE